MSGCLYVCMSVYCSGFAYLCIDGVPVVEILHLHI